MSKNNQHELTSRPIVRGRGSIGQRRGAHSNARAWLLASGWAAVAGLAGCGAGEPAGGGAGSAVVVRDSAGITIVENGAAGIWEDGAEWRLSPEPDVHIGVLDGAQEYQLFQVTGAVRLSDGRIAIASTHRSARCRACGAL